MSEQRRLNPRLEIELPAEYRVESFDRPCPGRIANLSAGGAAVVTERQLPPHSLLDQFRFALPDDVSAEPVEATAVVVHARPYLNDDGVIEYCSGVHFLGLQTETFERLERFVWERLQSPPSSDLAN